MDIKNKKILVTGGAGFIGSNLIDKIIKDNKIIVLDDFSIGSEKNLKLSKKSGNLKIIKGDIVNLPTVKNAMSGIDIVFHLAALGVRKSINNPFSVHQVNALGTLNLLFEARKNSVERFIHISSSEVYGSANYVPMDENHPLNPETIYGASKLAGEMYALSYFRTYDLLTMVIRPFNTYGPRSHFEGSYGEVIPRFVIRAMNDLPPIIFGNGLQTRDFTYIEDTVSGILSAAKRDNLVGDVVNIAFGKERSIKEVAQIVLKKLAKNNLKIIYQDARPGDVKRHFADTKKAKRLLGFRAKTSLEKGIEKYIDWLKTEKIDVKKALMEINERNW
ncbi:MAG: Nucleoside-diphosphate-sugar epimerase [Microgenomates group bacterium GW2011_GWA2_37_6]|nr:MAG: Nucleoside-diphosphate-sugar epimerase [Microgenomates group bacterium GW2011_GWA2_37_6]